jgi:DNA-binding NarL/FixJ family response regulator
LRKAQCQCRSFANGVLPHTFSSYPLPNEAVPRDPRNHCPWMDHEVSHARVLLADSHLGMLSGVHSLVKAQFETVLMVADEKSLLEAITTFKPDLVVVDLSLPNEEETNIARRLMLRHPDMRLIVLSVHDDANVVSQVREAGASGFVLKRTAGQDLIPAIHEVLRGQTYVSPAAQRNHQKFRDQLQGGL